VPVKKSIRTHAAVEPATLRRYRYDISLLLAASLARLSQTSR